MNFVQTSRKLAVSVLSMALGMCGSAQAADLVVGGIPVKLRVTSMKEARFATTVHQQYDFSCGSAALATLLSYHYGYPVSEQVIFEKMFQNGDQRKIRQQGFSLLDMQRFLSERGFKADGFELSLAKLAGAKLPAIVLINEKGYSHFVVVKGLEGERILVGDPSSGTRAMPLDHFNQLWANKLLFVIHGFSGKASFNGATDWVAAPAAPLGLGVNRGALAAVTLALHGPGEF